MTCLQLPLTQLLKCLQLPLTQLLICLQLQPTQLLISSLLSKSEQLRSFKTQHNSTVKQLGVSLWPKPAISIHRNSPLHLTVRATTVRAGALATSPLTTSRKEPTRLIWNPLLGK